MSARYLILAALALTFVFAGCGDDDPTGPGASEPVAVGAAYPNGADGRIVLINADGNRYCYFDPSDASFTSSKPVSELADGESVGPIEAVTRDSNTEPTKTYFFEGGGLRVAAFDEENGSIEAPKDFGEQFAQAPFDGSGAAFTAGTSLFFFDRGGSNYAAYDSANDTWSPVYSFLSDFGGGGAPISAVGAALQRDDRTYLLFNYSGRKFCIYSSGGTFSAAFDIEDLGDGTLSF